MSEKTETSEPLGRAGGAVARGKRGPRAKDPDGAPNAVDLHVGARVRLRRTLMGLTQSELGDAVGLTFQQVQKYEKGANRISASRLYQIAERLDVPIGFFFDDLAGSGPQEPRGSGEPSLERRDVLELARAFGPLAPGQKAAVYNLIRAIAAAEI